MRKSISASQLEVIPHSHLEEVCFQIVILKIGLQTRVKSAIQSQLVWKRMDIEGLAAVFQTSETCWTMSHQAYQGSSGLDSSSLRRRRDLSPAVIDARLLRRAGSVLHLSSGSSGPMKKGSKLQQCHTNTARDWAEWENATSTSHQFCWFQLLFQLITHWSNWQLPSKTPTQLVPSANVPS